MSDLRYSQKKESWVLSLEKCVEYSRFGTIFVIRGGHHNAVVFSTLELKFVINTARASVHNFLYIRKISSFSQKSPGHKPLRVMHQKC